MVVILKILLSLFLLNETLSGHGAGPGWCKGNQVVSDSNIITYQQKIFKNENNSMHLQILLTLTTYIYVNEIVLYALGFKLLII